MKTALLLLGVAVSHSYGKSISSHEFNHLKNPEITSTCNNVDWMCGEPITVCGSGGPYGNCICAGDVNGHTQCVQDTSCESMTRCSDGGECPMGSVCLSSQNCCGVPNCVPLCSNSTTTETPTTTTQGPDMCSGINWSCGGSVTVCGDLGPYGECFCGDDVQGNQDCFIDEACSTQTKCSQNTDCPSGSSCVTGTCCDYSLCLPLCSNNTKTTTPAPNMPTSTPAPNTPAPTSSSICSSVDWICGESATICGSQGPLGECFCDQDVQNNHYCMIDDYCSDMSVCATNSQCAQGSVCATSCCGSGNCFVICNGNDVVDPVERLLPITAFSVPSDLERQCAQMYVDCRENCSEKFGRCTAKYGQCPDKAVKCLEECKETREKCWN